MITAAGGGFRATRETDSCDDYHRPLQRRAQTPIIFYSAAFSIVGEAALVSITTIILVVLGASVIVAAIVWRESAGH
jgi:hypothetical protein